MKKERIRFEFRQLTRGFLTRYGAVLRLAEVCGCHPDDIVWAVRDLLDPVEFWSFLERKPCDEGDDDA